MNRGAVAIFVKTPGLSPIKTRLGRVIGTRAAEEFYALSVEAAHEVSAKAMKRASSVSLDLTVYWAIAEPAGVSHPMWHQFEYRVRKYLRPLIYVAVRCKYHGRAVFAPVEKIKYLLYYLPAHSSYPPVI